MSAFQSFGSFCVAVVCPWGSWVNVSEGVIRGWSDRMEFNGCGRIFHSVSHSHPEAGVRLMVWNRLVSGGCLRRNH